MTAFFASLFFVTLAEMGDKTQLLAVAFAARYSPRTVIGAVFVATLLNHALAVETGQLLTAVIPLDAIQLVAALSFILFGLWTIRGDTLDGEDARSSAYGPFMTVAIAFFLAEIGDKTQLATISLAIQYDAPLSVLMGTTSGMLIADGVGILVGTSLLRRIPEAVIRTGSAGIFIVFGLAGAGATLWRMMPGPAVVAVVFTLGAGAVVASHALLLARRQPGAETARAVSAAPERMSQLLFAGLVAGGWAASLDLVEPLDSIDHWLGFALLAALGWKTIHGAVRVRTSPALVSAWTTTLILVLAGLTCLDAIVPMSAGLVWFAGPGSLLLAAVVVVAASPVVAARRPGRVLGRIRDARFTIASGLLLLAIAAQVLIDHIR